MNFIGWRQMMRVDRRQFIVAGLGGAAAACHPFFIDPTEPWLSVQIPGMVGIVKDEAGGGLTVLMVDAQAADSTLQRHFPRLMTEQSNVDLGASSPIDGKKINQTTGKPSLVYWDLV